MAPFVLMTSICVSPFVIMTSKRVTPLVLMACFFLAIVDVSYCSNEEDTNLSQSRQMVAKGSRYNASSEYSSSYSPDKAATGGYWCSEKNAESPSFWWISFEQEPVEIVEIRFEEKYPGATFEFFASDTEECSETGRLLINGTRDEINGKIFANGERYNCYGLKITNLPNTRWGRLASLKNFHFGEDGCDLHKCSEHGSCIVHGDNSRTCNCDKQFTGKDCEIPVCDDTWKAKNGKNCQDYRERKYCKLSGDHYGYGWNKRAWGTFERWSDALGRSALVCSLCGCGGDPNAKEEISTYVHLLEDGFPDKSNRNEGRLEVWSNGKWNTICDRDVTKYGDLALAKVVCHMLGEKFGEKVMGANIGSFHYHNAYPPEESDVDYLCRGNETSIFDCETQPRNKKCHIWWDDVAIKCSPFTNP